MDLLNGFNSIDAGVVRESAERFGTPHYLYDERMIAETCEMLISMPHAYGLDVRYAMKANSTKALLKVIRGLGLKIDASSLNEVRRAHISGFDYGDIMLTSQEAPEKDDIAALREMLSLGLKYNVCSLKQLRNIGDYAAASKKSLGVRIHPGVGSGETATRNTGDKYSCFGIHLSDLRHVFEYANDKGIVFDHVHVHIGSGGDPAVWQSNIDLELGIVEKHFPDAVSVSFGGGLRVARMPDESAADVQALGLYAKDRIEKFYGRTGRKLRMEVEPGTFVMANAGFVVTSVVDKKKTGDDGFNFLILDGGMEVNARPLLYASRHPFYVISKDGRLLSSEFRLKSGGSGNGGDGGGYRAVLVGRCCESGDSQCLDSDGLSVPREMAEPELGDYIAIGGAGAYCSAMSPHNYNSFVQAPEVLYTCDSELKEIRVRQTLEHMIANER